MESSAGPDAVAAGVYWSGVNEQAARRLGTNTQDKRQKWLTKAQAGIQRWSLTAEQNRRGGRASFPSLCQG